MTSATAYVIAHEVGHHVQNELGILGKYHRMQPEILLKRNEMLSVSASKQADYLARCWARSIQDETFCFDIGDIEEGMKPMQSGMTSGASLRLLGTR